MIINSRRRLIGLYMRTFSRSWFSSRVHGSGTSVKDGHFCKEMRRLNPLFFGVKYNSLFLVTNI
jgi:hypothetical protein